MIKAFVAGATGFTGRAVQNLDSSAFGLALKLHVRTNSPSQKVLAHDPRIVQCSLDDPLSLAGSMVGHDAVIQLIGTVRKRFDANTNYETVDLATTRKLLEAAQKVGVRHFVLLSSSGASLAAGSYLATKKRTEELVQASRIPFTIVRPGFIAGNAKMTERPSLSMLATLSGRLAKLPGCEFMNYVRPMDVDILAKLMLFFAASKPLNRAVGAPELWDIAHHHRFVKGP
jgi:nucleoside-diphosphate-sugar epimerase